MNTTVAVPARPIQHIANPGVPSIYVEGLSQMMLGFPNSRMMLYSLAQKDTTNPDAPELRHMACELIIPTIALIEMTQTILSTLVANKTVIEGSKKEWSEKVDALTNSLQSINIDSHDPTT